MARLHKAATAAAASGRGTFSASAKVSASAYQAQELGLLRASDGVSMNRERLLADAKARALALAPGYQPPEPGLLALSGASGRQALLNIVDSAALAGRLKPHDLVVGKALADVLSGGEGADVTRPLPEDALFALELAAFLDLVKTKATQARIRALLETGKPIRN